jgi:uncharacterized protein (DUF697 family)
MNATDIWHTIRDALFSPKVDEAKVEDCLRRAREQLPVPVFWLLGKTQSGKTSLIRALTNSPRAEIGNGFRACTRTARLYDFPNENESFLRFLDTRGLGEAEYDPADDIRLFEDRSHLLIVVLKAADHAPQAILGPLAAIHKAHPRWPVIVLQTSLHELYPPEFQHVSPYPFDKFPPSSTDVPIDLGRSLAVQRTWFEGYDARFVPVDFTLPEDGFTPEHYGLKTLWGTIEEVLPLGLRAMLTDTPGVRQPLRDAYFRACQPHVISYSAACGIVAAGVFVPLVDMPLVLGIQLKLLHTIASIYGQQLTPQRLAEIVSTVGVGLIARQGGRELLKLIPIPGVGSAAAAIYASASTYALGCTLCAYFSYALHGDVPDPKFLQALYRDQLAEGRLRFQEYLRHRNTEAAHS